ncbi:hypothetical protein MAR_032330 [Mya arenaria]|uniref:Uncharacterized protein n=1 Tax=Mya arenaria TaxID=6604 RepID=A0ABY7FAB2_MYAAR|nr:hypothetical protein MAR_032330 [Mya arenaria]
MSTEENQTEAERQVLRHATIFASNNCHGNSVCIDPRRRPLWSPGPEIPSQPFDVPADYYSKLPTDVINYLD